MKKLSIEEKAKAYDEAIERAKKIKREHSKKGFKPSDDALYIFPELKENNDEKIRKALLEIIHDTPNNLIWVDYGISKNAVIAWLEKQGEQNTAWSEEDERNIQDIDSVLFYDKGLPEDTCMRLRNWLESLRPQNVWNPSKEQMLAINIAINVLGKGTLNGKQLIELQEQLKRLKRE